MQRKYELGTSLTYFLHRNEKKISLNVKSQRFRHTCPSFLLSKFASKIKLIQSVVASLKVPGSHSRIPSPRFLTLASQSSRSQDSRVPGRGPQGLGNRVPGLGSQSPKVPGPGSHVSDPDFRLCLSNQAVLSTWPKSQDKKLNILSTKRAFKLKLKAFFIIFIEGESPIFYKNFKLYAVLLHKK